MTRRPRRLLGLALLLVAAAAKPADVRIAVVTNRARKVSLTVEDAARIFLKQRRFWDDGAQIVPLNREAGSALREAFSTRVFGVPSAELAAYWNTQYFLGTFPPATLSSTAAVKRYVAADADAIGYVEASEVDETVRTALQLDDEHAR